MSKIIKNNAIINYNDQTITTCDVSTVVEPVLKANKRAYTDASGIITAENNEAVISGTVGKDRTIVYEVVLSNYSSKPFTDIVVTDTIEIPAPNQNNFEVAESNYTNTGTIPQLIFEIGDLPSESTTTLRYKIKLGDAVPVEAVVKNKASIVYAENPEGATTPVETESVEVTVDYSETTVEIEKIAPESVLLGEAYQYLIEVTNTGDRPAHVTTIEDDLPEDFTLSTIPEVPPIQITVGGGVKTEGVDYTKSITDNKLIITAIDDKLDIPPGSLLRVVINGSVNELS